MSWTAFCFGIPALQVVYNIAIGIWAARLIVSTVRSRLP